MCDNEKLNTLYKSIRWWWLYCKYAFGLTDHPTVKTVFSFSDPTDLILICACGTGPRAYLWVWGRWGRRETRPRPLLRPSPAPTARPRAMVWGRSPSCSWRAPVRTCNAAHANEQMKTSANQTFSQPRSAERSVLIHRGTVCEYTDRWHAHSDDPTAFNLYQELLITCLNFSLPHTKLSPRGFRWCSLNCHS